jgi:CRISPR type IV-associated protein Csf1
MIGLPITSSVVVAQALGYAPEGVKAKKEAACAFCGMHIAIDDLSSQFSVSPAFMDDLSLAVRGGDMTCGHCAPLMTADALRKTGYGVFAKSGITPFRKWGEIAAALANPPHEPFVALYATANNQHMAWRAPVNFSPELFYVRVGLRDLKIRHAILMQAVDVSQVVGRAFGFEAGPKTLAHPFVRLSSDLKEIGHGSLRLNFPQKAEKAAAHQELLAQYREEIDFLMNLTLGETWALRFLLTPGAGEN